jgi:hypothetical protein
VGRERLRDQSRTIREELDQIEYQGKHVYYTLEHNTLAQVKRLQAMLDIAIVEDLGLDHMDKRRGQDPNHHQSLCEDSASSITHLIEHGRDHEEGDLCDIIRNRDAHSRIEKRCQE